MRWPAILALVAAVAALAVTDWTARGAAADLPEASPAAVRSGYSAAGGETWFCVGGVGGAGGSRQQVSILNTAGSELRGAARLLPAVPLGGRSQQWPARRVEFAVAPYARVDIDPAATVLQAAPELASFPEVFVAAEVRLDQAGGIVTQAVAGAGGEDGAECVTAASSEWHVAAASTRRDAQARLALLNPFSDDAVADITVATDEGRRDPVAYQGLVVPAGALVVLDLGSEVARRSQVALSVRARSGNLAASLLQTFNGDLGLSGLSLRAGAPRPQEQWLFPLGVAGADDGAANSFVIYNPGGAEARVDLAVEVDAALGARGVPPFELTVPPGQRVEVTFFPPPAPTAHPASGVDVLAATTRVQPSERYWVSVRSFNSAPVVAERLRTVESGARDGVSVLAGRAAGARRGVVVLPGAADDPRLVSIVNPSLETISRLSLEALTGSGWVPLERFGDVEIRPRQRLLLDLAEHLPAGALALRFAASEPLAVSHAGPGGAGALGAVAETESISDLEQLIF
ncbi:MAG: hypothetical protein F4X37_08875 [Acidimicrobiia bacterium]|nr:hypothetical protein [Acidimicrobiia bacterium]MYB25192.1 hypothetical protein [Acidimicrobiia bacterium]